GVAWDALGREQTAQFQRDMANLNVLPPTPYPRATEEIPTTQESIGRLIESGHAYAEGTGVYSSAGTDPTFAQLARLSPEAMALRFEETGDPPTDPNKRDR